jgi:hypothetical protein
MSLAELLPMIHALPAEERKRLLQILREELGENQPVPGELPPHLRELIVPCAMYPVHTPFDCYEAAAVMQRLLNEGKSEQPEQ